MDKSETKYSVPAVDKALSVLELLAESPDGATQSEIARKLGRSVTSLYRVFQVLEHRGYIYSSGPKSTYHLSLKMFEVANRHYPVQTLVEAAHVEVKAVCKTTLQSCHLALLNGLEITIIHQQDPPLGTHYSVATGSRYPALETSSGAVLVAYSDREIQQAFFDSLTTETEKAALKNRLDSIVRNGSERLQSEVVPGILNLSVPVFDYTSSIAGVVTIPFLSQKYAQETQPDEALEMLKNACKVISRNLGYKGT
ncbi:IclR family transcriptional regulator [Parasalinivibrio latis]|uniref:IclR family transcriptional regulator n=1 Tax=Parasalinivibrio latis TaxID=2952610 RepID=UPI0030DE1FA4